MPYAGLPVAEHPLIIILLWVGLATVRFMGSGGFIGSTGDKGQCLWMEGFIVGFFLLNHRGRF